MRRLPQWGLAGRLLGLALAGACATTAPPSTPRPRPSITPAQAEQAEFLQQLLEQRAAGRGAAPLSPPDRIELLNRIEHLLPAWRERQRRGTEAPLERLLHLDVVLDFKTVADAFLNGAHDRRVVAAWALGFSRVPPNNLGLESPHIEAIRILTASLETADDAVMRNILLGLWKIADPSTPVRPLLELLEQHHDPDVRANAALALGTVLTPRSAPQAASAVRLALRDAEPKVRLHTANVARRFPDRDTIATIEQLIPDEPMSLVRAAMAAALGAGGSRASGAVLVRLLSAGTEVERVAAHRALQTLYGTDRGTNAEAWRDLLN